MATCGKGCVSEGQALHKEMRRAVRGRTIRLVDAMETGMKQPLGGERDVVMEDRMDF